MSEFLEIEEQKMVVIVSQWLEKKCQSLAAGKADHWLPVHRVRQRRNGNFMIEMDKLPVCLEAGEAVRDLIDQMEEYENG